MSLSIQVTPVLSLPALAEVETVAKAKLEELLPLIKETRDVYEARLKELGVTPDDIAGLITLNPKVVDQQIRGKLATLARYEREAQVYGGLVPAYNAVAAKIKTGEISSMFETTVRPLGRTAIKAKIEIVDPDLLALRNAGLLG